MPMTEQETLLQGKEHSSAKANQNNQASNSKKGAPHRLEWLQHVNWEIESACS